MSTEKANMNIRILASYRNTSTFSFCFLLADFSVQFIVEGEKIPHLVRLPNWKSAKFLFMMRGVRYKGNTLHV